MHKVIQGYAGNMRPFRYIQAGPGAAARPGAADITARVHRYEYNNSAVVAKLQWFELAPGNLRMRLSFWSNGKRARPGEKLVANTHGKRVSYCKKNGATRYET